MAPGSNPSPAPPEAQVKSVLPVPLPHRGTASIERGARSLLPGSETPILAPLTAIFTVQVTLAESVSGSVQRLLGVLFGILVIMSMGTWYIIIVKLYEQAKLMGKGDEMKQLLFKAIHKDQMQIFDRLIREALVKQIGLDPVAFEAGLASAKPARAFEEGKKWGLRVKVQQTPTVVLDGNIKVEELTIENLKTIIQGILDSDRKR